MNETQAMECADRLKGLFPKISQAEQDFWQVKFLAMPDPVVANAAMNTYAASTATIDRPTLLGILRTAGTTANERHVEAWHEYEASQRKVEETRQAVERSWQKILDELRTLAPEDVRSAERDVIEAMGARLRRLLEKQTVETSLWLRHLVYRWLVHGRMREIEILSAASREQHPGACLERSIGGSA